MYYNTKNYPEKTIFAPIFIQAVDIFPYVAWGLSTNKEQEKIASIFQNLLKRTFEKMKDGDDWLDGFLKELKILKTESKKISKSLEEIATYVLDEIEKNIQSNDLMNKRVFSQREVDELINSKTRASYNFAITYVDEKEFLNFYEEEVDLFDLEKEELIAHISNYLKLLTKGGFKGIYYTRNIELEEFLGMLEYTKQALNEVRRLFFSEMTFDEMLEVVDLSDTILFFGSSKETIVKDDLIILSGNNAYELRKALFKYFILKATKAKKTNPERYAFLAGVKDWVFSKIQVELNDNLQDAKAIAFSNLSDELNNYPFSNKGKACSYSRYQIELINNIYRDCLDVMSVMTPQELNPYLNNLAFSKIYKEGVDKHLKEYVSQRPDAGQAADRQTGERFDEQVRGRD